jgi:hypothetical protein
MSSRIILLSNALDIKCALITEELTAWKMRCGLMNSVQLKRLSQVCNKKVEASYLLKVRDRRVLTHRKPDTKILRLGNPEVRRARKERSLRHEAEALGYALIPLAGEVS